MKKTLLGTAACALVLGACDARGPSDDLVGSWERQRADGTLRDRYIFRVDGELAFDEFKPDDPASEDHLTGTYTATGDTVVALGTDVKDGTRTRYTFTYYANATMFATQALRSKAGQHGIVGEWTGSSKLELLDEPTRPAEGASATYQFRADGTYTATGEAPDGTALDPEQGTYREEPPGTFNLATPSGVGAYSLQLIDGAALVFPSRIFKRHLPD